MKYLKITAILLVISTICFAADKNKHPAEFKIQITGGRDKILIICDRELVPIFGAVAETSAPKDSSLAYTVSTSLPKDWAEQLADGKIQVVCTAKPLTKKEKELVSGKKLAYLALAVVVAGTSPVKNLTARQVTGIFCGGINDWSLVSKLKGGIIPFKLPDNSPLTTILRKKFLKKHGFPRNMITFANSSEILLSVENNPRGIGYINLIDYIDNSTGHRNFRKIKIDGIEASAKNVRQGKYPYVRTYSIYTGKKNKKETTEFVKHLTGGSGKFRIQKYKLILPK